MIPNVGEQKHNGSFSESKKKNHTKLNITLLIICILLLISNLFVFWSYFNIRSDYQKQKELVAEMQMTSDSNVLVSQILQNQEKNEETDVLENIATEIHIGDRIDLDFVEITFDEVVWGKTIYPKNNNCKTGNVHVLSDQLDKTQTFLGIRGTIKNTGKKDFDLSSGTKIEFIFNDKYSYTGFIHGERSNGCGYEAFPRLEPLEKINFTISASFPEEILEIFTHAQMTFGFDEGMISIWQPMLEYDYIYRMEIDEK